MSSEFRRNKFVNLFKFFDKDKSGFIEQKHFELSAQYISGIRKWEPGSDKNKETAAAALKIWDNMQKIADTNSDGKVSVDEWVAMWDNFARNPSSPLEWQILYCKFIFDIEDATGDGVIDAEEFSSVFMSAGKDKSSSIAAFEKMAKGKSSITWPEFQELWKEFFTSDDPDSPGNYIFGELTF